MEQSVLDKLGAVEAGNYTCDMFLLGLRCYVMKVLDVEVFFSECDFATGEDLRPKDIVDFYYRFKGWHNTMKMSKEIVELDVSFVMQELEGCIRVIKQKAA